MKNLSKILSAILTAVMLLSLFTVPAVVHAEGGVCGENLTWTLEDGVLTISGTGPMNNYLKYNAHQSYAVERPDLDDLAPWGTDITSVVIEDGVTTIGDYAFYNCQQIESIEIPASVKTIGDSAFFSAKLKTLVLPEGVEEIGDYAFCECTLESKDFHMPDSLAVIGDYAFRYAYFGEIQIGSGVVDIGAGAFTYNVVIDIPDSVQHIGNEAFKKTRYYEDAKNWRMDALYIGKWLIKVKENTKLEFFVVKRGTEHIADYAFENCKSLKDDVILPKSLKSIGRSAFQACNNLEALDIPEGVTDIGPGAFSGCKGLTELKLPESITEIGDQMVSGLSFEQFEIPDNVERIGEGAFLSCNYLKSITIPSSIKRIESWTFTNFISLEEVNLPEGLESIGDFAFLACASLRRIVIPRSVTSIGMGLFYFNVPTPTDIVMAVYEGSYAQTYAEENGVPYEIIDEEKPIDENNEELAGDMDGDGEITVSDALRALRIAAGLDVAVATKGTRSAILGDVDGDGAVTVADALQILRKAAGLA
ncbi:MAG: leucine-rich repeat protein [Clostridia bacterium]|nr:leucine-rich repeat protein [Clostridia bacterium]